MFTELLVARCEQKLMEAELAQMFTRDGVPLAEPRGAGVVAALRWLPVVLAVVVGLTMLTSGVVAS